MATVDERWERGIDHDSRSVAIAQGVAAVDEEQCQDSFGFKFGGDGDNGDTLLYLLDVYFERLGAGFD
jgi:hypothetical protein